MTLAGFPCFPAGGRFMRKCGVCADEQFTEVSRDGSGDDGGAGPLGGGLVGFE